MTNLSNYPPGHPTGVSRGEETSVYYCEECNWLLTLGELKGAYLCPKGHPVERAPCDNCGEPATHIDTDREVNASEPFCSKHGM